MGWAANVVKLGFCSVIAGGDFVIIDCREGKKKKNRELGGEDGA